MNIEEIEGLIIEIKTKIDYINSTPVLRHKKHIKFRGHVKSVEQIEKNYKRMNNLDQIAEELKEINKDLNFLIVENNVELVTNESTID